MLGNNAKEFVQKINTLALTPEELEDRKLVLEDEIERKLKALNQSLHDEKQIVVNNRVQLVAGLIMAGLGAEGVPPLRIEDLAGREYDDKHPADIGEFDILRAQRKGSNRYTPFVCKLNNIRK